MVTAREVKDRVTDTFPDCSVEYFSYPSRSSECFVIRKEKGNDWYEAVLELRGLPNLTQGDMTEAISGFQERVTSELATRGLA